MAELLMAMVLMMHRPSNLRLLAPERLSVLDTYSKPTLRGGFFLSKN
jgi:hypothetical protein